MTSDGEHLSVGVTRREANAERSHPHRELRDQERQAANAERARVRRERRAPAGEATEGHGNTRERIQSIALDLFIENGYEATSLREIAERLGVTKAALYYHFKTKDDIINSLIEARLSKLESLLEWARAQPRDIGTRQELLRRYSQLMHDGDHFRMMRFFERNQTAMQKYKSGDSLRDQVIQIIELLCDRDAPLTERLTCSLAIFALHASYFIPDPEITDEQRRDAGLEVALDLIERGPRGDSAQPTMAIRSPS